MNQVLVRWTGWLTALLVAISFVQPSFADDKDDDADEPSAYGAQLLPKETLVYFSIPSMPGLKRGMNDAMYGELMADPEFQPFLEDVQKQISKASDKLVEEIGVSLEDLVAIPEGELTIALVEHAPEELSAVVLLDYGENEASVEKLIDQLEKELAKEATKTTEAVDDIELQIFTLENPGESNPFKSVCFFEAKEDNYFVLATDPEPLRQVLARWDGSSEETLAKDENYKYIYEQCKGNESTPLVEYYLNPIGLVRLGISMIREQVPQSSLALGFISVLKADNLKAMGGTGHFDTETGDATSHAFVMITPPTQGLFGIFTMPAVKQVPPPWVAATVPQYIGVNWDLQKAYATIGEMVDAVQGPGAFERLVDQAADADDGAGVHIKKDVIDKLTGRIHVLMNAQTSLSPDQADAVPALVVALGAKDSAAMAKLVAKAEDSGATSREFEGVTIYEVDNQSQKMALAVAKEHVFFTTSVEMLEGIIRASEKSLAELPAFKELAGLLPEKVSILQYADSESQLKAIYEQLRKGEFENPIPELDFTKLPEFSVVQKYLKPSISYVVPDKKGSLSVTHQKK